MNGAGRIAFAIMMIAMGVRSLIIANFAPAWAIVPKWMPAQQALVYLTALVSLAAGLGMLWRRSAGPAARALLSLLVIWLVAFSIRALIKNPLLPGTWQMGHLLVLIGATLSVFAAFATDRDRQRMPAATGDRGFRIAQICYGAGLIPFGYAHFANVKGTVQFVPAYLPWPEGWAYFTGAAFIVAGVAIIIRKYARLATILSAWQMGLFSVLIWIPRTLAGLPNDFQKGEVLTTFVLAAAGWAVAESYQSET